MRKKATAEGDILIATFNEKNRTVSDEHLSRIFAAAGKRYGYGDVSAEFAALGDFKVRWQRSYRWARFTVSDYLDRAPDDVLKDLAEVVFAKINDEDRDYDEVFIRYITDHDLTRENRKDFLKRSRHLAKTSIWDYHDLNDCVDRLRDAGLIPDDMNCELRRDRSDGEKAAGCSVLQRVVWVNRSLDNKGVPEHVLDYSVYAMIAHLIAGFNNRDEAYYDRLVAAYPMRRRKAEKQVTGRFGDTSISHLGYYRPGSDAANYYAERKSKGTLPVAVKPARKKKSDATKGTVTGPVGATAVKSGNRRVTKARK